MHPGSGRTLFGNRGVSGCALRVGLVVFGVLGQPAGSAAQQMQAELRTETVYLGTATYLDVVVVGRSSVGTPRLGAVDGLEIALEPGRNVTRDLFSGAVRRRYRFRITPRRTGSFTIPAVTVNVGGRVLKRGPFRLRALEATLRYSGARIEPEQVVVGQNATLSIAYQGTRPDAQLEVPQVDGLAISAPGRPRIDIDSRQGVPVSTYELTIRPARVGAFAITGISLDGVAADPIAFEVHRFVVLGTRVGANALVVGGKTTLHVFVRGLSYTPDVVLNVPSQLTATPTRTRYRSPDGSTVFSFSITARQPGDAVIESFTLPDKTTATLDGPVTISIRQSGEGGVFFCHGTPRKQETVVGEPFVVDFETAFRGKLAGAGVNLEEAAFTRKDYIKVEPVNDIAYEGWTGRRLTIGFGRNGRLTALSGTGTVEGRKEQMLRFALKITPLAAGALSLDGLRVVLTLQVTETRRTAFSTFSSSSRRQHVRTAEIPPHNVVDPPGVTRPALYRGAVGRMTFETSLDRDTAMAMSPMTLTMRITGQGVGPQLAPPPIADVPELRRSFDVSPTVTGGEVADNAIEFKQTIRPLRDSVKELPALPLVYYDYQTRKYDTVYSLPVPVRISAHAVAGIDTLRVAAPNVAANAASDVDAAPARAAPAETAIRLGANHNTLGQIITTVPADPTAIMATLVGGPSAILLAVVGCTAWRRRRPAAALRREARSIRAALDTLTEADGFHARLAETTQAYLRLRLSLPPGELSPAAAAAALAEHGGDAQLQRDAEELLTRCDTGRFGAASPDATEREALLSATRDIMHRIDRAVR